MTFLGRTVNDQRRSLGASNPEPQVRQHREARALIERMIRDFQQLSIDQLTVIYTEVRARGRIPGEPEAPADFNPPSPFDERNALQEAPVLPVRNTTPPASEAGSMSPLTGEGSHSRDLVPVDITSVEMPRRVEVEQFGPPQFVHVVALLFVLLLALVFG